MQILLLMIFGGLGGISRFLLGGIIPSVGGFPLGDLFINIIGSLILPIWNGSIGLKFDKKWLVAIGTGFIGAFTTFSGVMLDILKMQLKNNYSGVFLYIFLSIVLGIVSAIIGSKISQKFNGESK